MKGSSNKGNIRFARIRGRIVPIKVKKVLNSRAGKLGVGIATTIGAVNAASAVRKKADKKFKVKSSGFSNFLKDGLITAGFLALGTKKSKTIREGVRTLNKAVFRGRR